MKNPINTLTSSPALILGFGLVVGDASSLLADVSKEKLDSITTPNQVGTSGETLEFLDGAPAKSNSLSKQQ